MTFKNLDSDSSATQATELKIETHLLKKEQQQQKTKKREFLQLFHKIYFIKYLFLKFCIFRS